MLIQIASGGIARAAASIKARRPSADSLLAANTQPLHVKLDRLLRLMMGLIALRTAGRISHNKTPIAFVPKSAAHPA